ncbi:MAG: hypothetical protein IT450_07370 [Phycisphaerales bacterium]|nr:hypothetical protein [Phycisphaerales bacterium]
MSAIAKAMTSETVGNGAEQELGPHTRTYQVGFGSTKGLMILGAFMILVPVLLGIVGSLGRDGVQASIRITLFLEILFLPLGSLALWGGLRQRRVRLSLHEQGFEYVTPGGKRKSARYTEVNNIALRKVGLGMRLLAPAYAQTVTHDPNSLAIELKGGWALEL